MESQTGVNSKVPILNCATSFVYPAANPVLRVAVIADFLEEQWPSMNLVSEMITQHIEIHHGSEVAVTRLFPPMRRRVARIPIAGNSRAGLNADRLIGRFWDYPRWLRRRVKDFDLFHIIDHTYAQLALELPPGRTVVTCHDLDAFRCLLQPDRDRRPAWFRAMSNRILKGFRRASRVICVSSTVQQELLGYDLFPPERVSVIHNGVHPSYSPERNPLADKAADHFLKCAEGKGPLLLNVGIPIPRKRLDILLRVFAEVRAHFPEARLVRVGGPFQPAHLRLVRELALESAIIVLPYIEREVLAAIYRRAALLLHTSEAEGFGLPLVEAMACGCPVAASDLPVLHEVGGSKVTFCPVADVAAWSGSVVSLLREWQHDGDAWSKRRRGSIERATRFSWVHAAEQTTRVYREVLGSK